MSWTPIRLLAPNPGPMTLGGTNTWVLAPEVGPAVVIDPGPEDDGHLAAVANACPNGISEVWVTHHHHDHIEAAPGLAERFGAAVRAYDPALCDRVLRDRETVELGDRAIEVRHLPGHTADSIGFVLHGSPGEGTQAADFFSGDMVLGEGTTVIVHPDGDLRSYLASLDEMLALVADHEVGRILPGHGPDVADPVAWLDHYRTHRHERLQQVREAVASGLDTVEQIVEAIYGDVPEGVRGAAAESTRAQLAYLEVPWLSAPGVPPAPGR
ncbi:MBL fold metallo-hydrolase [Naumannella sp. ID2617S]|uniref:MBL fold metallo-hydrolase n=1 Tax=Enemella dayhoffiae TaxID=2016507 RepID=A0A255H982_9ACTN|nr:MBL fold metallo-hydrolase [Enemella dayhoffiae]NNG19623.1 MBL fold metallo-hydrolase [Naumannella sp. ID2617S]OYO24191.1 MBL fold metallo-hydrolase [Enemella dayhoffiae]